MPQLSPQILTKRLFLVRPSRSDRSRERRPKEEDKEAPAKEEEEAAERGGAEPEAEEDRP